MSRRFDAASDGPETDRDGGGYHRSVYAGKHRKQRLGRIGELAGRSRRQGAVSSPGTWWAPNKTGISFRFRQPGLATARSIKDSDSRRWRLRPVVFMLGDIANSGSGVGEPAGRSRRQGVGTEPQNTVRLLTKPECPLDSEGLGLRLHDRLRIRIAGWRLSP